MQRNNWKDQTCETCQYRVDEWCKQGPHATIVSFSPHSDDANQNWQFLDACGQYEQTTEG